MALMLQPPTSLNTVRGHVVFLGGSIEMGAAPDWQSELAERLRADDTVTLLNPRRDDWDSGWTQSASNPLFREQVEWELAGLERADTIVMYLDPCTKSPVSMLELGLHARGNSLIVCCPDGFWRKGNIEIVCERYRVPIVYALADLADAVGSRVRDDGAEAILVRRAIEGDLPLVRFTLEEARAAEARTLDAGVVTSAIRAAVRDPIGKATYYVAEPNGEPVGHCSTFSEWSDWRDTAYTWVQSMYVAPAARGTGVMQALLDRVTRDAKAAGSPEIRIYVHTLNDRARAAWRREGFADCSYWMASRAIS